MFASNYKSKQYLLVALKILILGLTLIYIYSKLYKNDSQHYQEIIIEALQKNKHSFAYLMLFLLLASANWFFEIMKWKVLVSKIQNITFLTSLKQSLSALTISLATPNRIGDYGAKAFYFKKEERKQILVLNFFSYAAQMGITTLFGVFGLLYMTLLYSIEYSILKIISIVIGCVGLFILGYIFKEQALIIKGLSIAKILKYLKNIKTSVKVKTILFSFLRYVIFCFLFYRLLLFFGIDLSLYQAIPIIFSMYLLVSIVPTIFIFDVVVRGGAAVWLFSFVGISETPVLCTVLSMWILNFVIPSIVGGIFMFTYRPETI
jgi:hypothetical protein